MHECENCGQVCDCDIEDTWHAQPIDCICDCEGFYDDDEYDLDSYE